MDAGQSAGADCVSLHANLAGEEGGAISPSFIHSPGEAKKGAFACSNGTLQLSADGWLVTE